MISGVFLTEVIINAHVHHDYIMLWYVHVDASPIFVFRVHLYSCISGMFIISGYA